MSVREHARQQAEWADFASRHTIMINRSDGKPYIVPLVECGLPVSLYPDRAERDAYYKRLAEGSDPARWASHKVEPLGQKA